MTKQCISNNAPKKVNVIGVPISVVNIDIVLDYISSNFDDIRGNYICASNVHTTVMAYDDKNYHKVQSESIISLPDGKPLATLGNKKGYKEMQKTTGTHFMQATFTDDRFKNKKHYFYGSTKENLEEMIKKVKNDYPNLEICGYEPSIFKELDEKALEELIYRINSSNADFVWIGIGAPRQEILMNRLKEKTNSLMTGVGGAFNILSGKVKDAPKWMQNAGLEWFYRFIKEPRRLFKRYFVTNSKFIWYNWRDKL
ncbi:MAG: WecB/TagA/CpsF family glycosyltransferase [Bacilli bacterium]|nr:WecB/TagA/CpsF family glycosyltransferase [Bacilli bacterium]